MTLWQEYDEKGQPKYSFPQNVIDILNCEHVIKVQSGISADVTNLNKIKGINAKSCVDSGLIYFLLAPQAPDHCRIIASKDRQPLAIDILRGRSNVLGWKKEDLRKELDELMLNGLIGNEQYGGYASAALLGILPEYLDSLKGNGGIYGSWNHSWEKRPHEWLATSRMYNYLGKEHSV